MKRSLHFRSRNPNCITLQCQRLSRENFVQFCTLSQRLISQTISQISGIQMELTILPIISYNLIGLTIHYSNNDWSNLETKEQLLWLDANFKRILFVFIPSILFSSLKEQCRLQNSHIKVKSLFEHEDMKYFKPSTCIL